MRLPLSRKQWAMITVGIVLLIVGICTLWQQRPITIVHVGWEKLPIDYFYYYKLDYLEELKKHTPKILASGYSPERIESEIQNINKLYGELKDPRDGHRSGSGGYIYKTREDHLLNEQSILAEYSHKFIDIGLREIHFPVVEYKNKTSKNYVFTFTFKGTRFSTTRVP